jgi:Tfp pilus assembly protein PilX
MSTVATIVLVWSATAGPGLVTGVTLAARNSATLLVGTLFAIGIARTAARIAEFTRTERENLASTAAAEASLAERRSHVRRLRSTTGELLARIAEGTGLSEAERRECRVVEGALRDEARAPNLAVEPLVSRVRALRRAGVQVVLLDERGQRGLSEQNKDRLIPWLVAQFDSVAPFDGSAPFAVEQITARIPPGGRGLLATVVIEHRGQSITRSLDG